MTTLSAPASTRSTGDQRISTARVIAAGFILAVLTAVAVFAAAGSSTTGHHSAAASTAVAEPAPQVQLAANAFEMTAQKTAAFTGCIVGVGAPIGIAIGIASNPAVWAYVLGKGPLPASIGGAASNYIGAVKNACAYALR